MAKDYTSNVFVNCPFDEEYKPLLDAIVFAIFDCGFVPRCALEEDNSGNVRFEKIKSIIAACKFGVHDISRTDLDGRNGLPRFNMPLELGVFLGAQRFGDPIQKRKNTLVLETEQYRYQIYISDIAGHDIRAHGNQPGRVIAHIRNWLNTASGRKTIPGGAAITRRYNRFLRSLPQICAELQLEEDEVMYNDYCVLVSNWLREWE